MSVELWLLLLCGWYLLFRLAEGLVNYLADKAAEKDFNDE